MVNVSQFLGKLKGFAKGSEKIHNLFPGEGKKIAISA
jgi:hypothetical protein